MQGIYSIKNEITAELYIGSAVNIQNRFKVHKHDLRHNKHGNPHLQRSWNKYGESAFRFQAEEIVEDKQKLIETEQQWFDILWDTEKLFNIDRIAGSRLGAKLNEKQVEYRKACFTGNKNPFFGKKHTEETREKMRQSRNKEFSPFKGRHHTEEAKIKNASFKIGTTASEETKKKMSLSQKARRLAEKTGLNHETK